MIVWAFCAVAAGKSATIVYINGAKYYIHTVQAGETTDSTVGAASVSTCM